MVLKMRAEGVSGDGRGGQYGVAVKVLAAGITDMVRISDARMSGTAYGTVVLHVSPEAAMVGRWRWCGRVTGSSWTWQREAAPGGGRCGAGAAAGGVGSTGAGVQDRVPVALCKACDAGG